MKALLAEGRFYSDLELTEKEIERMVIEASRAEYLADDKFKQQPGRQESSTSGAEPSSSGASEFSSLITITIHPQIRFFLLKFERFLSSVLISVRICNLLSAMVYGHRISSRSTLNGPTT